MKRILAAVLSLVLLLGCVSFASAEETTIRIVWWGSQNRHDVTVAAVHKFMEKNPDIKVEVEYSDWGGYWSKLATQAAGNVLPDVIQMDYSQLASYAQNGILADLSSYFESGALDISHVADSVIESGEIKGVPYALSCGTNALVMMYRPDVLEAAGITMPEEITAEEYAELCKKVYDATGKTGLSLAAASFDFVRNIARCYGGDLYNDEGTALGFDNPEYLVRLWQGSIDAEEAGWQLPVGETTAATGMDIYVSDTWIDNIWTNQLAAYEQGSGCELKMVPCPDWSDATRPSTYFKPSMFWSVAESSENKDAAVKLIDFLTNDPECFDIVGTDRAMPISSVIREYLAPKLDENSQEVSAILDYLGQEGKTSKIMNPDLACHSDVQTLYTEYYEMVQYRLVDDLTAHAQAFIDEANAIITRSLEK